ncbi:MAG: thioesterase family protein [Desulfobacteraceae bacterium]|jgi:YbgC/YbaW family acyl-CoA thioester hydrolase
MKTYRFSISMTVRSSDLNYANHVGYQNFFSFFQEARIRYLDQFQYSEMEIEGYGMIVGEANCKYKRELFLNDAIAVACGITEFKSKCFIMGYQLSRDNTLCAEGFTKNYCYDYLAKRVMRPPEAFVQTITAFEALLSS